MHSNNCKTNQWFHPRNFIENNIDYRIVCSKAFARFKASQASVFNEVKSNPLHQFSKTGKELLLLKYDIWFDFLCELEQYLLAVGTIKGDERKYIIKLAKERATYFRKILSDNKEVFDSNYIGIWLKVSTMLFDLLKAKITNANDTIQTKEEVFNEISECITNLLHHTLYEVYEIDVVVFSDDTPFLSYDEVVKLYNNIFNTSLLVQRFKIYNDYKKINKLIIKDYTNKMKESDYRCIPELKKYVKDISFK